MIFYPLLSLSSAGLALHPHSMQCFPQFHSACQHSTSILLHSSSTSSPILAPYPVLSNSLLSTLAWLSSTVSCCLLAPALSHFSLLLTSLTLFSPTLCGLPVLPLLILHFTLLFSLVLSPNFHADTCLFPLSLQTFCFSPSAPNQL